MFMSLLKKVFNFFIIKPILYTAIQVKSNKKFRDATIHEILWNKAIHESSEYVQNYLHEVLIFNKNEDIWTHAVGLIREQPNKIFFEFGCFTGSSINFFAKSLPEMKLYGFDSFEGLPNDWKGHHASRGSFNLKGKVPTVESNVVLVRGWFDQVLPEFNAKNTDLNPCFLHIDSDTYESATCVLHNMRKHIKPGMIILFDEYLGYPNWKQGEYLAWQEFCSSCSIRYQYIAFGSEQALIKVI